MSIDSKLENVCDHLIFEEQLEIDSDLKTLRIPRTLGSMDVTLRINGFVIEPDNELFGWSILDDETAIYTKKSKIVLKHKRKAEDDFYTVNYAAVPKYCPKCQGLRILNDEAYTTLGKLRYIRYEDKLLQEIKKGLATHLGSNPFHTWIGTQIHTLIGTKIYNQDLIKSRIVEEVSRYLEKYIDVQLQQGNYQDVDSREAFGQIISIEIEPQTDIDISYWVLAVIFSNRTGSDLLYEKKIDIPGPANILYGSQQPSNDY